MNFELIIQYYPILISGLKVTIYSCAGALFIGLTFGIFLYQLSESKIKVFRLGYKFYITIFRGTPLLVQVYLLFYGGPLFNLTLSAVQVGILGMGFYVSAYFAEIYRSGFESLAKGQVEAARDLGFSKLQTLSYIQFPQMLGLIIPPLTNQSIILIKESAILSIITVPEISTAAIKMATETYSVVEPYVLLAGSYWVITYLISILGKKAEEKATQYLYINQRETV